MVSLMLLAMLRQFLACHAISSTVPIVLRAVQGDAVHTARCFYLTGEGLEVLHGEVWLLRNSSSQWSALLVSVQQPLLQHGLAQCDGFSTLANAPAGGLSGDHGGDG